MLVTLTIPEVRLSSGLIECWQEEHLVMLVSQASKEDKYQLLRKNKFNPAVNPRFFSQHFWLAIYEESIFLALEGFLQPANMEEWEQQDELHTKD